VDSLIVNLTEVITSIVIFKAAVLTDEDFKMISSHINVSDRCGNTHRRIWRYI